MILSIWRITLLSIGSLLGCRFIVVALQGDGAVATTCLVAGSFATAILCRPAHTLGVFVASVPILSGLARTGLINSPEPLLIVFSSVLIGLTLKTSTRRRTEPSRPAIPGSPFEQMGLLSIYGVASVVTLSWVGTVVAGNMGPEFRHFPVSEAVSGFGSPWYFWTSTLIWLAGLLLAGELIWSGGLVQKWHSPIVVCYIASIACFASIQIATNLPEALPINGVNRALSSPYEDIHSLGAISVSVAIGLLASLAFRPMRSAILGAVGSGLMVAVIIGSWSRATWLAGILGLGLIVLSKLGRRWVCVMLAVGGLFTVYANQAANGDAWRSNDYLRRLGSLVRFENPANKDPSRVALYQKAFAMIRARPLAGYGIGSFYLTAIHFAAPDDPLGSTPNFAHNFLLQFAAELGLPATILLLGLVGLALYRGVTLFRQPAPDRLVVLGVTCALICYLLTQLTANAVNIYVSNQFYFWPLVAALLSWPKVRLQTTP